MNLGKFAPGDNVIFYANTIDTAGSRIDATGNVNYLVYENENGVAVAGPSIMALLGGAGSGLYSETLALGGAFTAGNRYSIYIWSTVDGEVPSAIEIFDVVASVSTPANIADAVWDEPIAGHAFGQTYGALQYLISNYLNTVQADAANSTTSFRTNYGVAFEGQMLGRILRISSGANAGACRIITAYDPVTDFVTVAPALPFIPGAGVSIPTLSIPTFWEEVWRVLKANVQGETITGNVAEDTDNLQVTGKEG